MRQLAIYVLQGNDMSYESPSQKRLNEAKSYIAKFVRFDVYGGACK